MVPPGSAQPTDPAALTDDSTKPPTDAPTLKTRATTLAGELRAEGVAGVAVTIVDNSGVVRVKGVPLARLADAATKGVGGPPVFDAFGTDDSIAPVGSPIGDLRLVPDLDALTVLAGQPGWAWAPADRFTPDGAAYAGCQRRFARRMAETAAAAGYEVRLAFETEWVLDAGRGDELVPVTSGPAYGMGRLIDLSDYGRDLLEAFDAEGVEAEQLHPEYAPSQFEVSAAPLHPVGAADRVVLVRQTIRAVAANHGYRVSFSPAVAPDGVGNGAHVHLSLWRDGVNLLAETDGRLHPDGEAWMAGILDALPALLAVVAPSMASYLRLRPQRWAAPWRCWGRENREAALRLVSGSAPEGAGSNVEVKVVDASANPYLVVGALIAAGLDGIKRSLSLPPEVTVDPASLDEADRVKLGVTPLPTTLAEALDAFEASPVPREAMGSALADTWDAVRRAEVQRLAHKSEEEVAIASRWVW